MRRKKTVLFYRDFRGFTGGHLKVFDYFRHVVASDDYQAKIYFTPESVWVNNPWYDYKKDCLPIWDPEKTDILFLAGMDWLALDKLQRKSPPVPVINFIQHVRHADPDDHLFQFLSNPATRICVSEEVSDAIMKTDIVNGSIVTNPNGLNFRVFPQFVKKKDISIFIDGIKNPILAEALAQKIKNQGMGCYLLTRRIPREKYLALLNSSRIAVFLPHKSEGFYLPAMEAMYLRTLVICPDCIGNRSFCIDNVTCLRPSYAFDDIYQAVRSVHMLSEKQKQLIMDNAYALAEKSTLSQERERFYEVLSYL